MQAAQVVGGLGVTTDKKAAMDQIKALYTVFDKSDCTMVEVRLELLCEALLRPALRQEELARLAVDGRCYGGALPYCELHS